LENSHKIRDRTRMPRICASAIFVLWLSLCFGYRVARGASHADLRGLIIGSPIDARRSAQSASSTFDF
jgi:hypothetical protein